MYCRWTLKTKYSYFGICPWIYLLVNVSILDLQDPNMLHTYFEYLCTNYSLRSNSFLDLTYACLDHLKIVKFIKYFYYKKIFKGKFNLCYYFYLLLCINMYLPMSKQNWKRFIGPFSFMCCINMYNKRGSFKTSSKEGFRWFCVFFGIIGMVIQHCNIGTLTASTWLEIETSRWVDNATNAFILSGSAIASIAGSKIQLAKISRSMTWK